MRAVRHYIPMVAVLLWLPLRAEVIQLKNGNTITGKLTAVNGYTFEVKTDYGEIQVPRSDVVTITFPENQAKKEDASTEAPSIDESLDGTTYTNRSYHFQATVPQGWTLKPELRRQAPAAVASGDQALFFMVTEEPFSGNLNTYKVMVETQFMTNFMDCEKLSESEVTLDGKAGTQIIFHGKPKNNPVMLKFVVDILPYDGRTARLTFTTLEPLFNDGLPIFNKIATSYHSTSK
jgi:small nuclear ribonucleoprotein (snRNP)-like protein